MSNIIKYSKKKWAINATLIRAVFISIGAVLLFQPAAFAQSGKLAGNISGKTLSYTDSVMVKDLFFKALREKTVENLVTAAELFQRVIQIDPGNAAAMYELANLKKLKSDYSGAQGLLEKAVVIDPGNKWYWTALADCYEKSDNIDKLENVFDQLIRLDPDKPDNYFDKANVYYHQQKYDEALQVYDQIEHLSGPTDDLLADRQKVYLKQGKVDLAAKQLEKMISATPSEIKYYLFLSELYTANNLPDKALKVLQTAEKVDAGSGLVHLALADIYLAHVHELLERRGEWDSSAVVVMGDHSWRTKLLWENSPYWTAEDQVASHGGQFDDRPAYIVKLPHQTTAARVDSRFAAARTRELLDGILDGSIRSVPELADFAQAPAATRYPLRAESR